MNEYLDFVNAVQAARRRAEALDTALCGALGVAADPLPHQLATVHRVLSDSRIRHLLADEVGLGKTVQALMILNALRWQNPSHRAVILAPERLLSQWNEECWTRAHTMTSLDPLDEEEAAVKLLRPAEFTLRRDDGGRPAELDPYNNDMLIIDEPQTMPLEVVQYVARVAASFRQVLVLSATPRLSEARWREPVLRILEPEMSEKARRNGVSTLEEIKKREMDSIKRLQAGEQGIPLYKAAAANRRIIRSGREDWARYLPQRRNIEIIVPPLQSERERHELAAALPVMESSEGTDLQSWTAVKALQSNRRTAGPVMRELAAGSSGVAELARQTASLSLDDPGDSRLEALLDVLSENLVKDNEQTFVIVCGNTPTMDLIEAVIPRYFPDLADKIARLDRLQRTETVSEVTFRQTREVLEQLLEGASQILLVGEWVQAGMNLHHFSRNIVFYSVPWQVDTVDQLIGRVDRLHPETIREQNGAPKSIRIWRLVSDGSQEQAVVKVLADTGVFERPLPPMTDDLLQKLYQDQAGAARGESDATCLAGSELDQSAFLPTHMADLTPWTRESAEEFWENWVSKPATEPAMRSRRKKAPTPIDAAEDALSCWLDVIEKSQDFQIGRRSDKMHEGRSFGTLWYGAGPGNAPRVAFPLPQMATDRFMSDHKPFLKRRVELSSPPVRTVMTDESESSERPLHFLDHGDPLHDALVRGYLSRGKEAFSGKKTREAAIRVPAGHPAEELSGPVLISTIMLDPLPDDLLPEIWSDAAQEIRRRATSQVQLRDLEREQALLREGYLAAQRWMRLHIPATLGIVGARFETTTRSWQNMDQDSLSACLKPRHFRQNKELPKDQKVIWVRGGPAPRSLLQVPAKAVLNERLKQLKSLHENTRKEYSKRIMELASAAEDYVNLVRFERSNLSDVRHMAVEMTRREEVPEDQTTMKAGRVAAAERTAEMSDLATIELLPFIKEALSGKLKRQTDLHMSILLHVMAAE